MIRVRAKILISLFILILLSSCGEKDVSIKLEYWTHEDQVRQQLEERLISEFEQENPGIDVVRVEYESSELLDIIKNAFQAGSGPDLFNLPSEEISTLLGSGFLDEIDIEAIGYESEVDLFSEYISGAFDTVSTEEAVFGLPLECTNWCLYVNKRLLDEAGIDPYSLHTWEDIAEASEHLAVRDNGILKRRGFDFRYPYYLSFFIPMVRQLGGDIISPDGKVAVYNEAAWENALSFMMEWGPYGRNLGSPTYINARNLFNSEEIAMCLSGLYQESRLESQNPAFFSSGEWAVAPFPVFEDAVRDVSASPYFHYFMVNDSSDSPTKSAAWRLAAYFADHAEEYLSEIGLIMPLKRIMSSELLNDKPFASVFLFDLERSEEAYDGVHASSIQTLIGEAVESVMLRSVPPEKAVQALRSSIEMLLE